MTKIKLLLAFCTLGSVSAFAAVCGGTAPVQSAKLDTLLGNTCTFTDATLTWSLGNWTFNDTNSAGFLANHAVASDITVTFIKMSTFSYSGLTLPGNIAGVFVQYTYTPTGSNYNFFNTTTLNPGAAQKSSFKTGFGFEQLQVAPIPPIFTNMFGIINAYTVSGSTGGDGVQMTKNYQDTTCPTCPTGFENVVLSKSGTNGNAISVTTLIPQHAFFNVSDDITLSAGSSVLNGAPAVASINFFGNGQYVTLGGAGNLASPEPGTVGLIGVGLLALGVLKRRMRS